MKTRVLRIPIAVKLISITVLLLAVSSAVITLRSADQFANFSKDREAQSNMDQSRARATEVEGVLLSYIDKAKIVASLLMKDRSSEDEREKSLDLTFHRDKDFVVVEVIPRGGFSSGARRVVNEPYLAQYKLDKSFVDVLRSAQKSNRMVDLDLLFAGKDNYVEIRNSTLEGGAPLLTIGFPLAKDDNGSVTHIVLAEVRLDRLQKVFSGVSERTLFLVDSEGRLLAHPQEKRVMARELFAANPIVKRAMASQLKQEQAGFVEAGQSYTGAFTKTGLGVIAVAVVDDDVILEAARIVKRDAFKTAGQAISIALFAIFVFSIVLTMPIEALAELTNQVAQGNFNVRAKAKSHDEVGQLGEAFNQMIEGLVERDKVKSMFSKFHGSSVTEDLMKGDLQLGGSKKNVTVFFSDIRDFTKFSEGRTPEEVVDMLNEYFHIMVKIINTNGGVVDKFIGDAIMAVWGAPKSSERDPQHAVKACIEMRQSLAELNKIRADRGQVPIKIGMGLHRGDAISGTIGSEERMEYTVIGDTVNQASRIESSTKAFGADLLLSEGLAEDVKDDFIVEFAGAVEVKGKGEPLKLYKVRGYFDEQKNPIVVRTEFSDYEAGDADKVKMAS